MLWKTCTSASRISPLRGSTVLGPTAFSLADGTQRTMLTFAFSPRSTLTESAGTVRATIACLKPAASNAGCHSSTPRRTQSTSHVGVAGST
jgi:hypothetical protein